MLETIKFLIPPFIASFIIVGMHAYLGIHVIKRGIIFVDLAFAQLAALGAIVSLFWGLSTKSTYNYLLSFGFILIGSIIFSFVKSKNKQIPKEAIIGIVYGLLNNPFYCGFCARRWMYMTSSSDARWSMRAKALEMGSLEPCCLSARI